MSFDVPAAESGRRAKSLAPAIDAALLAGVPMPYVADVRPARDEDVAALRDLVRAEAAEWRACLARLERAAAWFEAHDRRDPNWKEAQRLDRELNARMFRARLSGGNALLKVCGATGQDKRRMWLATFPCPHRSGRVAAGLSATIWWDAALGALPAESEVES